MDKVQRLHNVFIDGDDNEIDIEYQRALERLNSIRRGRRTPNTKKK